jgi:hypothetical protein
MIMMIRDVVLGKCPGCGQHLCELQAGQLWPLTLAEWQDKFAQDVRAPIENGKPVKTCVLCYRRPITNTTPPVRATRS